MLISPSQHCHVLNSNDTTVNIPNKRTVSITTACCVNTNVTAMAGMR